MKTYKLKQKQPTKKCSKCRANKPSEEFCAGSNYCKLCQKEYRKKHSEKISGQIALGVAKARGATVIDRTVTPQAVYDKFGGVYQGCGTRVYRDQNTYEE